MTVSSLFRDPRYAALMATARAMLEQSPQVAPPLLDPQTARRLVPALRSAQLDPSGSVERATGRSGGMEPAVED